LKIRSTALFGRRNLTTEVVVRLNIPLTSI